MFEITFINKEEKEITVEEAIKLTSRKEMIGAKVVEHGVKKIWDVTDVQKEGNTLKVTRVKGYDTYIYTLS